MGFEAWALKGGLEAWREASARAGAGEKPAPVGSPA
jgi:hypothetical protein